MDTVRRLLLARFIFTAIYILESKVVGGGSGWLAGWLLALLLFGLLCVVYPSKKTVLSRLPSRPNQVATLNNSRGEGGRERESNNKSTANFSHEPILLLKSRERNNPSRLLTHARWHFVNPSRSSCFVVQLQQQPEISFIYLNYINIGANGNEFIAALFRMRI